MTVVVKKSIGDYRLYLDDGTQLGASRSSMPNQTTLVDMLEEEYSGNSMLANSIPRSVYTDIVTENYSVVDTTAGETSPWNSSSDEVDTQ